MWITVVIPENFQHTQVLDTNKKRLETLAFGLYHHFCWTCILVLWRKACFGLTENDMEPMISALSITTSLRLQSGAGTEDIKVRPVPTSGQTTKSECPQQLKEGQAWRELSSSRGLPV